MTANTRPCSPAMALSRLHMMAGVDMPYELGSGGYHPEPMAGGGVLDVPWTVAPNGKRGCDCWGAVCYAFMIRRTRPGYNTGPNRVVALCDVEGDVNSNSAIGDARDAKDLFRFVEPGELILQGDVLSYPSIRLKDEHGNFYRNTDGSLRTWIGHGQVVAENPTGVVVGMGYTPLRVYQCFGGEGRRPAIMLTDAHAMDHHDHDWPKNEHRTHVLRIVP